MHAVSVNNICKTYRLDDVDVPALRDITIDIRLNTFTVISGPSGSGKTTLLNMIGCIDRPDTGEIVIGGQSVRSLSDDELSDLRSRHFGFIFQNFNLLPVLTAYENIEYSLLILKVPERKRRERVGELLEGVGLSDKKRHYPGQLSGGQRQRVAIARALAHAPQLVMADEPTANLDSQTGATIIQLMRQMQRDNKTTFVFSSHDPQILAEADDAAFIRDGALTGVERRRSPDAQAGGEA